MTIGFVPLPGRRGPGSRGAGVHGATISNSTGRPRYPAASIVIGICVSGSVPSHALRSSAKPGGVRAGVESLNADRSNPAATNSFCQSTGAAGGRPGGSICGGAAWNPIRRPFVSITTSVMPSTASGGSPGPTAFDEFSGTSGRGLVRYQ